MPYTAKKIFTRKMPVVQPMYVPTGNVQLYVVRSPLFGNEVASAVGVYHSGILCVADNKQWALELTLDDFSRLVPTVRNDTIHMDNWITLGYYPPEDAHLWRSYWSYTSPLTATISSTEYMAFIKWIVTVYGPTWPLYVPLGITSKPSATLSANRETLNDVVYTVDNTCDKLGMRAFQWLHDTMNVEIAPFPVQRLETQTWRAPTIVMDDDPGLVRASLEMRSIVQQVINKTGRAMTSSMLMQIASENPKIFHRYQLSLDPVTYKQHYYLLPPNDVSLSVTDVFVDLGPIGAPIATDKHRSHDWGTFDDSNQILAAILFDEVCMTGGPCMR
jgi:hypothetical protein